MTCPTTTYRQWAIVVAATLGEEMPAHPRLGHRPGNGGDHQTESEAAGLGNVRTYVRDFVADGTGLPNAGVQYVMLFNILHAECPDALLREAYRVLAPGGKLGIIHWNYDPTTPRGPAMTIRPRPEQCREWAESVGFSLLAPGIIDLPPYHYGMAMKRLEDDMGA